jgi:hypothetical protein
MRNHKAEPAAERVQTIGSFAGAFLSFEGIPEVTTLQSLVIKGPRTIGALAWPTAGLPRTEREMLQLRLIAILKYVYRQRIFFQGQMDRLIESMMPPSAVPLPPQVLQARRNAEARDALLREFGAMTSAQIGERAGSKSPNRAALAHRWKSDGRIFAVSHQGLNYFPGFQFTEDGQPVEIIKDVLHLLGNKLAPWELALWFTRRNGWLSGRRPVDFLRTEPEEVLLAAAREAEELVF